MPFYGENTVAEHIFGLILALSRNIHRAYMRTSRGDFAWDGLMGFDLKEKTLGSIGAGHIGLHVIHRAKGFGRKVLAFDAPQDRFLAVKYETLKNFWQRRMQFRCTAVQRVDEAFD